MVHLLKVWVSFPTVSSFIFPQFPNSTPNLLSMYYNWPVLSMSYSMKTLFYLLAGAEHRQQQGTTSLINKHLLNWSTLGVYFTTFLFQRADCSLNSRKWMSRVLLLGLVIEWTNRIVSRTYSDVSFRSISHTACVCLFVFQLNTVGAGPFSSIFDFNKKIPIKRRYYFAPLVTSSLDSIVDDE